MLIKYCEELLRCLKDSRVSYEETLVRGSIQTMEDVRNIRGIVRGIELCEAVIKDRYRQMFEPEANMELEGNEYHEQ